MDWSHLDLVNSYGEVFIVIILNLDNELIADPIVYCPSILEDSVDIEIVKKAIIQCFSEIIDSSFDDEVLSEQIRSNTRSFIRKKTGLKPLTCVEIVRI